MSPDFANPDLQPPTPPATKLPEPKYKLPEPKSKLPEPKSKLPEPKSNHVTPEPNHVTPEPVHVANHVTSTNRVTEQHNHVIQPVVHHVTQHETPAPVPPVPPAVVQRTPVVRRPEESIPVINHIPQTSPPKVAILSAI